MTSHKEDQEGRATAAQTELLVVDDSSWLGWEPDCQPPCNECWKLRGYRARGKWLVNWLKVYTRHEADIIQGRARMPNFSWAANEQTLNPCQANLGALHRAHCVPETRVIDCNCHLAFLMRAMWDVGPGDELEGGIERAGAPNIVGRYLNTRH
jgi:hypothetical protein